MKRAYAVILCTCFVSTAFADDNSDSCFMKTCPAGTTVVATTTRHEPSFLCPTLQLQTYVGLVVGMLAMQAQLGVRPEVNPDTGEPAYTGESKAMVDAARANAHVSTFDQAMSQCKALRRGSRFEVQNSTKDAQNSYVFEQKTKSMWWAQKAFLKPVHN